MLNLHPVTQTKLLLVLVIAGTIVSNASARWGLFAGAFVAGMAAGRIVRIVQRASG